MKHIITALNTSKNYTQLSVKSGLDAVAIYKQLLYNPQADTQLISQDLKEYCKQDTQAILDVLKFLISQLRNV